jgi:hypothetical protein
MAIPSEATEYKVVKLAAGATLSFLPEDNTQNGVIFVFDAAAAAVKFTEKSSVKPADDGTVPVKRLVFNRTQSEVESPAVATVTIDEVADTFTSTEPTVVGYYGSAIHDGISCSAACVALIYGRKDAKGY